MERQDSSWQRERAREELLLRFLKAYDEGNLEVFKAVLQQAESDPDLDTLIWATFPLYLCETKAFSLEEEKESRAALLQQSSPPNGKKSKPLQLTVADVAARIQVELTLHRTEYVDPHIIQRILNTLIQFYDPLPPHLDLRTIHMIFSHHELSTPPTFDNIFLKTARFLQEKRGT